MKYFVPTKGVSSWQCLLASPEKQWKPKYSAYELAHSWEQADGFPKKVQEVFASSGIPFLKEMKLIYGFPEYKVPLLGGGAGSQNDLYVLAKSEYNNELSTIMVEGKVDESFDETVNTWLGDNPSNGKRRRLDYLIDLLDLQKSDVLDKRYQLLHRTASALIEAEKVNAPSAMMLIHSFSQTGKWFSDYEAFVELFNLSPKKNQVVGPLNIDGLDLYFGWVSDDVVII